MSSGGEEFIRTWKTFRPAIWLGMIGLALILVVNLYLGIAVLGAGIGTAARIQANRRRLRRAGAAAPGRTRRR